MSHPRAIRVRAAAGCALVAAVLVLTAACSGSGGSSGSSGSASSGPSTSTGGSSPTGFPDTSGASSTPGPVKSVEPVSVAPTPVDPATQLEAQTNGEAHTIVAVSGGKEAATYDENGNIQFWRIATGASRWTQIGESTYPDIPQVGPPSPSVRAARLAGMTHATYIVHGLFSGDGSGNAVAFTTGAHGWGAIKAESNGNIGPSGKPVGSDQIGLSYDFGFVGGDLQTEDCPADRPISDCGAHPVKKLWRWNGTDFSPV